ncbi:MAG TPA: alpha/beta hydrolase-fold protein [Ferruginibacter sp.]|nr:alpha/beta hydrolase-fold protein [Ferruginibacter sp.]HRO17802.1 alpha/beta hydrolase-fold protein [Ferruginibacter sp.]HRQ20644.1 alpha/beta hydrolase-fold protein [Ferruginibacter sp.]
MEVNTRIRLGCLGGLILLFAVATLARQPEWNGVRNKINHADTIGNRIKHAVSNQVQLVHSHFPVESLDTTTSIWIYLPSNYSSTRNRYPVIYFLGGEHAFSDSLSPDNKEWLVDEALDSLNQTKAPKAIVVAVHRFFSDTVQVDSASSFLMNNLKPYIDSVYRTQKESAVVAGSGQMAAWALYTTLRYPEVFKKAGIFSPSADIFPYLKNHQLQGKGHKGMLFFYEGNEMDDLQELTDNIGMHSSALIYSTHHQNPKRHESPMGGWFPEFYNWILGNGYNYIIRYKP